MNALGGKVVETGSDVSGGEGNEVDFDQVIANVMFRLERVERSDDTVRKYRVDDVPPPVCSLLDVSAHKTTQAQDKYSSIVPSTR